MECAVPPSCRAGERAGGGKIPDVSQGQSVSDGTAVRDARRRVSVNLKEPNKATVSAEARISRLIPESRTVVGKRDVEMPSETENVFTETVSSVGYGGPVYDEAADIHIEEPAAPDAWVVEPPEVPEVAVPEIDILPPPPVSEIYNRTASRRQDSSRRNAAALPKPTILPLMF